MVKSLGAPPQGVRGDTRAIAVDVRALGRHVERRASGRIAGGPGAIDRCDGSFGSAIGDTRQRRDLGACIEWRQRRRRRRADVGSDVRADRRPVDGAVGMSGTTSRGRPLSVR